MPLAVLIASIKLPIIKSVFSSSCRNSVLYHWSEVRFVADTLLLHELHDNSCIRNKLCLVFWNRKGIQVLRKQASPYCFVLVK